MKNIDNNTDIIRYQEQVNSTKIRWENEKKRMLERHEGLKKTKIKLTQEIEQPEEIQNSAIQNNEIESWMLDLAQEIEQPEEIQNSAIQNNEIESWMLDLAQEIEQPEEIQNSTIYEIPEFDDNDDGVGDDDFYRNNFIENNDHQSLVVNHSLQTSIDPKNKPNIKDKEGNNNEKVALVYDDLDIPTVGFPEMLKGKNKEFEDFIIKCKSYTGFDLNFCNSAGNPMLFTAAAACMSGKIKILIEHGANINVNNSKGENLLGYIANHSMSNPLWVKFALKVVPYLINQGINSDNVNNQGQAFVELISSNDNIPSALQNLFISTSENPNAVISPDKNLVTPSELNNLTTMEFVDFLKKLQFDEGFNINSLDEAGNPLLFNVIGNNSIGKLKVLLDNGADINIKNSDQENILSFIINHKTSTSNYSAMARVIDLLIIKEVEVNLINNKGQSLVEALDELNNLHQRDKKIFISKISKITLDNDINTSDNNLASKDINSLNSQSNLSITNDYTLKSEENESNIMDESSELSLDNIESILLGAYHASDV